MGFAYLKLELKRAVGRLPYLYAGAVLAALLAVLLVLLGSRMLYGDTAAGRIRVGVALPEGDQTAGQAVRAISSMDSVRSVCDFAYMDLESGLKELEQGTVFTVLEVPEGFVQDIISGVNTPVTVWMPRGAELEGRLFEALTRAGARTLSASQAGIYAGGELYLQNGAGDRIPQLEADLNRMYLSFSLSRLDYFKRLTVSGTGNLDVMDFYRISAFVLLLFLLPAAAGDYLLPCGKVLRMKLEAAGLKGGVRVFSKVLGLSFLLAAVSLPVLFAAAFYGLTETPGMLLLCGLLAVAAVSVWVLFCYSLSGTLLGGLLFLFLAAAVQHFLAGGFLPRAFLPPAVQSLGRWMPSGILMELLEMGMTGEADGRAAVAAVFLFLAGLAACLWAERRRA